jgi:hypothetical protein
MGVRGDIPNMPILMLQKNIHVEILWIVQEKKRIINDIRR